MVFLKYITVIIIIFRSILKLSNVGSKIRLLGQILGKPCENSRGHSFDPKFMKKYVRKLIIILSRSSLKHGNVGSETRLLGQILEKPCVHSRGHSFKPRFMKLYQNVYLRNI